MNEKIKSLIIKYSVSLLIGCVLVWGCLELNGFSEVSAALDKYRLLTDAFSIPGIIYIMLGCLVFVSTDGFFDMISFALGKFGRALVPFSKKSDESFYDYKVRKSKERFTGYSFLFYTGLAFLAVAIVFLILFFSIY